MNKITKVDLYTMTLTSIFRILWLYVLSIAAVYHLHAISENLRTNLVMSILSSMQYCVGRPFDTGALWIALSFMPFSLFFDFMDGRVARWQKKSSLMGQELDSLADLVSIYPYIFFFSLA